ncbi:helix-turn-helix transcriptional regulator [Aliarcobacter sp. ERUVET-7]|uniref:helix-turn-helix transcriptional regulator n=1 Tax=Aliarcobacter sp. ERUVET-7 TaxID=3429683 RepID=UPI003D6C1798
MEHDKLATRLSLIIYKLNQGERLTIESLANEFGVSKRTIERDIARFSYFDIKKEGKEFFLDELAVGKLNFDDIKNFAIFSGKSLFPSLTNQFLKDILNDKINRAYMVQNSGFEDIQEKQQLFENLSTAIIEEKTISFFYNDKKRVVNPYKLINTNGIWYLSALENNTIKTYTFSKIKSLKISSDKFVVDKNILKEIEKSEINFLSKESKEVHLKIQNSAKEYFLRKKVLSNMKIIDNTDEYFVVSTNVSFDDEILNIVKQWIPYIEILKPVELQEKLEDVLKKYLDKNIK